MLRKFSGISALALSFAAGLSTPATAQNFNWGGFYAGVNAGGAWGSGDFSTASPCRTQGFGGYPCSTAHPTGSANATSLESAGSGSSSSNGFVGGAQAGYNWQSGSVVFGTEVDFGAFSLSGSRTSSAIYPVAVGPIATNTRFNLHTSVDTDWLFTARARLGWATGPMLLYATGGLAMTNAKVGFTYSDNNAFGAGSGSGSASDTKTGWTVGGGVEWAFTRNWSLKGEYLYVDFGSLTATGTLRSQQGGTGYASGLSTKADLNGHIARAGLNYKF